MREITKEYRAGFDCGINVANEENCNFRLFATPEQTKELARIKVSFDGGVDYATVLRDILLINASRDNEK